MTDNVRKPPLRQKKLLGIFWGVLLVLAGIALSYTLYDQLQLQSVKEILPASGLVKEVDEVHYYPATALRDVPLTRFREFTLYGNGAGVLSMNKDVYGYCTSGDDRAVTFFCGRDYGDAYTNIQKYEEGFFIVLGKHKLDYDSLMKEEGYFGNYPAVYEAGRLRIRGMSDSTMYLLSYRVYLNNALGNVYFVAYTPYPEYLDEAKKVLDFAVREMTDQNAAENMIEDGELKSSVVATVSANSADMDANYKPREEVEPYAITEPVVLENGDKVWQQGADTYIETTNYDYRLSLECAYDCLHVTYIYMDITQVPDSILLISPEGKTYKPFLIEQYKGEVTFLVEKAQMGEWILSVRNATSLKGADVSFMEDARFRELEPNWTGYQQSDGEE